MVKFDRNAVPLMVCVLLSGALLFAILFLVFLQPGSGGKTHQIMPGCNIDSTLFRYVECYTEKDGRLNLALSYAGTENGSILVTGLLCTQGESRPEEHQNLDNPVRLYSPKPNWIAGKDVVSGADAGNIVFCTDPDGNQIPVGTEDYYLGNLFIFYQQAGEPGVKTASGRFISPYEMYTDHPVNYSGVFNPRNTS